MSELKPCPFCGGEAKINENYSGYIPYCTNRECAGDKVFFDTDEEAIEEWNKRADNWISVDGEDLPKRKVIALGQQNEMIFGYVYKCEINEGGYMAENDNEVLREVTHWQLLPEPPKGE